MTVDPAWEAAHAARAWGKYPHPAVVEFIGRHYGMLDSRSMRPEPFKHVLDIGCGTGASAVMLADESFRVIGVDSSRAALDRMADRLAYTGLGPLVSFYRQDAVDMNFADDSFDAAIDVCCLSCLPFDQAEHVIMNAHDWLKPGGRMLSVAAADDCDPAVHGEFMVRQASLTDIDTLFGVFPNVFVGKHTRLTRRGFISEWVVEAQK